MSIKIYLKKGNKNYKENKLIKELQPIIDAKLQSNPDLAESFKPATTFEELQGLHNMYVPQEIEYEEIETKNKANKKEEVIVEDDDNDDDDDFEDSGDFVDPFNRESPIVRDYVTDGGMAEDTGKQKGPVKTQFDEPTNWKEAFDLDTDDDDDNDISSSSETKSKEPKKEKVKKEPLNPAFDDMPAGKQKQSTKKFAKYIVEAVCALAEKGFIWYANKDINDSKLAEYELNGEMDLSILVTLQDGQEATVKQFFQQQCVAAEQLAKFEEEEKKDMSECLAAVFLEKGIAPSTTQEALIVIIGVVVKKGAMLFGLKSQTNSLLTQLRSMNEGSEQQQQEYYEPQPQQQPQAQPSAQPQQQEITEELPVFEIDTDALEIDQIVETKE